MIKKVETVSAKREGEQWEPNLAVLWKDILQRRACVVLIPTFQNYSTD